MTTIATTSTPTDRASATPLSYGRATTDASAGSRAEGGGAGAAAPAGNSATNVQLSTKAQALLQQVATNQTGVPHLPASFDQMVTEKTSDLAATLVKGFTAVFIPLDQPISLQVDSSGTVHADGPYKKQIEKYFADNPDVAKEVKTVASLNALKATEQAMRLYVKEQQSATTDKDRAAASDRYMVRSMNIQSLSGDFTLSNGQLTSAATQYTTALSSPAGERTS
jgi:hypothetical protein